MKRKKTLGLIAMSCLLIIAMTACNKEESAPEPQIQEHVFSYFPESSMQQIINIGIRQPTNYDACIYLSPEEIAKYPGGIITEIHVGLPTISNSSQHCVWIRQDMNEKSGYTQYCTFNNANGFTEIVLDAPYLLGSEGVYVGYSFSQDKVVTEDEEYPIGMIRYFPSEWGSMFLGYEGSEMTDCHSLGYGPLALKVKIVTGSR